MATRDEFHIQIQLSYDEGDDDDDDGGCKLKCITALLVSLFFLITTKP